MNDNFELLDDNLKQLQNQQQNCSHNVLQELGKLKKNITLFQQNF